MDSSSDSDHSTDNEMDALIKLKRRRFALFGLAAVAFYGLKHCYKIPCRTGEPGPVWINGVLNHHIRSHQEFRLRPDLFSYLCEILSNQYQLKPTRNVIVKEKVAIFLYALGKGASNRDLQERFQHSGETISRQFLSVLDAVCRLARDIIRPEDPLFNDHYYPYFKDCIGAIDGTHIQVIIPTKEQIPYIGRKGIPTQNVMVVCDFDMCFTFGWAGWEGSAHDTRIFMEALRTPSLKFPLPPPGLTQYNIFVFYAYNMQCFIPFLFLVQESIIL
jgi:hypothetical protein